MYRNAVSAAIRICVFGWKRNYLQEICGKERYFEGGGCAATFLRARCAWAGSGAVAGTNCAELVMLPLAGGSVVDALVLRI